MQVCSYLQNVCSKKCKTLLVKVPQCYKYYISTIFTFIKKKWKSFLSVHSYKHQKHVNIWVLVLLPVNESGSTWPRWVTGKAWQTPGIGGRRVLYFCAGKKMTHLIWFLLLFLADYWVPRHKGLRKHSFHPVSRPGLVTSAPLGVVARSRYF